MIWGYPYFWKHPCDLNQGTVFSIHQEISSTLIGLEQLFSPSILGGKHCKHPYFGSTPTCIFVFLNIDGKVYQLGWQRNTMESKTHTLVGYSRYCWWFGNPIPNHVWMYKTLQIIGINYQLINPITGNIVLANRFLIAFVHAASHQF